MAKRTLPHKMKATQFKKGQSGNPQGARLHNPHLKALKRITNEAYKSIIEVVMTGTIEDLKAIADNPKSSAVEVGIARAFFNAVKNGDYSVIDKISERIIGKVKDTVHHTGTIHPTINFIGIKKDKRNDSV